MLYIYGMEENETQEQEKNIEKKDEIYLEEDKLFGNMLIDAAESMLQVYEKFEKLLNAIQTAIKKEEEQ